MNIVFQDITRQWEEPSNIVIETVRPKLANYKFHASPDVSKVADMWRVNMNVLAREV